MKRIRLIVCLIIFIPGCAILAGMGSVHTGSNLAIQRRGAGPPLRRCVRLPQSLLGLVEPPSQITEMEA